MSRNLFYSCRQKRHKPPETASFYNCKLHVLAQDALTTCKQALQRYHNHEDCLPSAEECQNCKFIADFPTTVHQLVNEKFSRCRKIHPDIACLLNECERCHIDPKTHLQDKLEAVDLDLTDEKKETSCSHTQNMCSRASRTSTSSSSTFEQAPRKCLTFGASSCSRLSTTSRCCG